MKKHQAGFSVVEIVIVLVILGIIGLVGWKFVASKTAKDDSSNTSQSSQTKATPEPAKLIWQQTADGWQSTETPPTCPSQPVLKAPADLSQATSVLYPGQKRGGNYKPHGGFRFDNTKDNTVTVSAPMDGFIVRGSRYTEIGETQYLIDVINNCGILYRFDHLHDLSPELQKIADKWPAPEESSRTTNVDPPVYIKAGTVFATKVGFVNTHNAAFDFGVYDLRSQNEASKTSAYQAAHPNEKELAWHAVCWLQNNWLSSSDQAKLAALPAGDPTSSKNSDYCK